jgi:hypothetical protein
MAERLVGMLMLDRPVQDSNAPLSIDKRLVDKLTLVRPPHDWKA